MIGRGVLVGRGATGMRQAVGCGSAGTLVQRVGVFSLWDWDVLAPCRNSQRIMFSPSISKLCDHFSSQKATLCRRRTFALIVANVHVFRAVSSLTGVHRGRLGVPGSA